MRIWLTGSGGFLGTRLSRRLAAEGHRVLGLSRRPDPGAEENEVVDLASRGVGEILADISRRRWAPETVIHAAAKIDGSTGFSEYLSSNLATTAGLLDYLADSGPVRLIFVSTLAVYGKAEKAPAAEDDPARPSHPYALSKLWAEELAGNSALRDNSVIVRLPSLFGAGQKDSFIDGLARQVLAGKDLELFSQGEIIRDALHVDDAVEGLVKCLDIKPGQGFTRINLGCGRPIRVKEWAEALVKALNSPSRVVPVDRPSPQRTDLYADISRAKELIGFTPTPLKETMERYARELQAQS